MSSHYSALQLIRSRPTFYLGPEGLSARRLAVALADCALISGAKHVQISMLDDSWVAVTSDANWIPANIAPIGMNRPWQKAFESMFPLQGGKMSEIRFEVVVAAFAQDISVRTTDQWHLLQGVTPPQVATQELAHAEFAVLFRLPDSVE